MTCFDFVFYYKLGKTIQAKDPLSKQANHKMEIDLDNTNQVLLKPKFFAINTLEATHKSPINDEIILKLHSCWKKSPKTISCYSSLVLEHLKNPCKTGTMRTDYSCTEEKYISLIA